MQAHWIVELDFDRQSLTHDDGNTRKIRDAIKDLGLPVHCVKYIPFDSPQFTTPYAASDCVVFYGSVNLVSALKRRGWVPGAWCDFERLRCSRYLEHWRDHSIHANYRFMPLKALREKSDAVFADMAVNDCIFIKPDTNDKVFSGGVVARQHFERWWKFANAYEPSPELSVLVSSPQNISQEWRTVVAESQVVAASQYRLNGEEKYAPGCPDSVKDFAKQTAQIYQPHPVFVMDIGLANGKLHLIEIGSVNCAGLYECDVAPVAEACSRLALVDWEKHEH